MDVRHQQDRPAGCVGLERLGRVARLGTDGREAGGLVRCDLAQARAGAAGAGGGRAGQCGASSSGSFADERKADLTLGSNKTTKAQMPKGTPRRIQGLVAQQGKTDRIAAAIAS